VADIYAADAAREIEKHISIYVVQSGAFSLRDEVSSAIPAWVLDRGALNGLPEGQSPQGIP
jgi:hypothetical protein